MNKRYSVLAGCALMVVMGCQIPFFKRVNAQQSFDATAYAGYSDVVPVVIVGGGVGGLTAGVYLSMANIPTLLVQGDMPGGLLTQSLSVRNWPGVADAPGLVITDKVREQAVASGVTIRDERLVAIDATTWPYRLTLVDVHNEAVRREVRAMTVIVAMGAQSNYLGIPGEKEYWSRGVTNCAVCEGSLYKNKVVCVVGGGNSAMEEAHYLSGLAKKVYVFVRRDTLRATDNRKDEVIKGSNIEMVYETSLTRINGDGDKVVSVETVNNRTKETKQYDMDGVFLAIGFTPNTSLFKDQLHLADGGYLALHNDQETSVPGIYGIGDIVDPKYKQAVTAAGDGCRAALQAYAFLQAARYAPPVVQSGEAPAAKPVTPEKVPAEKPVAQRQSSEQPVAATSSTPSWVIPGSVVEAPSVQAFQELLATSDKPVVVDFSAVWCGPCRQMEPVFKRAASALKDKAVFVKINIDVLGSLASQYRVQGVPTFVFINRGKEQSRIVGGGVSEQVFLDRVEGMITAQS